jgi:pantetheine-phosphate adenylyltransferase
MHDKIEDSSMPQPLTSALITALPDLQIPHFLSPLISIAAHDTQHRLIIVLIHQSFDSKTAPDVPPISHTEKWDEIQQILTYVYVQATKVAQDLGKVLMEVDVLLCGSLTDLVSVNAWYSCADALYLFDEVTKAPRVLHPLQQMLEAARQTGEVFCPGLESLLLIPEPLAAPLPSPESPTPGLLPVVALGGTFDHLHAGHKILLSMGAWIASEKLIVGITDDALLVNKNYKEVLEPLSVRTERVRKFLEMFKPGVVYDIVPITDVYGPTAWDPNIQALVVSKETLGGARSSAYFPSILLLRIVC